MKDTTPEFDVGALRAVIRAIPEPDPGAETAAWARLDSLTKPPRSLGVLEELAARLATLQGTDRPAVARKSIVLMAGDHGVTAEGVSPYPSEVTAQMVANFVYGGAAINQLAKHAGASLVLVDVGVASPLPVREGVIHARVADGTANMAKGPAMSRDEALAAISVGIETVRGLHADGVDLIGTGEMGIGNTTAAAAVVSALTGADPADVVGPGTGLDDQGVAHKVDVVRRALALNAPDADDALDVLAKVGGLEIAGLAGVVIGAASLGVPVVADGYISGAATLVAIRLAPAAAPWVFASHRSSEPGHRVVLDALGLRPVLELDMRLGEGTGAALAMELLDAACAMMSGMATFAEAGVTGRED
ncbi:MAG: nicotinate-nucleotide--dimethylbenzimidazole phosphoribosyltransferase [Coriobacteriia bacterium]|nr:nicotinate-nucleotide--dimethylbenzimidazole phosphoribosyltransferase [Coriobacteriia bacterium]